MSKLEAVAAHEQASTVSRRGVSKLRVGLLSQWYDPEPVATPAALARELARREHAVRVLTGFPNYPTGRIYPGFRVRWHQDDVTAAVQLRRVPLYASHDASSIGRIVNYATFAVSASTAGARWLKGVDALWVYNSPPSVGLPTWLIKARYRPRVVLHVMDLWPESLNASGMGGRLLGNGFARGMIERWLEMTYRVADAIACTSRSQVEVLSKRGVPKDKLSYVPIWTDESFFHPMRYDANLARRLHVEDKLVVLYAGALGEPQGLDALIEACSRLKSESFFHCLIAGSGVTEPRLRKMVTNRGLDNVTFLGRWPIQEMGRLMSVGDVHLISLRPDAISTYAMPSKLPATLAAGKPVVVAAAGDAARVIAGSGAGWVCPPGDVDALESALRSALAAGKQELREMGRISRHVYETEFSLSRAVDQLEELLAGPSRETANAR